MTHVLRFIAAQFCVAVFILTFPLPALRAESGEAAFPVGTLTARMSSGQHLTNYRYLRHGDTLRVENTRTTPPSPPVNLIDLESGDLTIVFPHNGTHLRIPAERLHARPAPAARLPVPRFPAGPAPAPTLEKTGNTMVLHGIESTLYKVIHPNEGTLEAWVTDSLGPFHFLTSHPPRLRGRRNLHETWPALLRENGVFPLLATVTNADRELFRFEVTGIDRQEPAGDPGAFAVPEGSHETELLPF